MNQTKTYCGNCQYYFNGQCSSPYPCYCGQPVEVNPRNYLKIVSSNRTEEQIRKETAKEILKILYDHGIDKEIMEFCSNYDVNGVALAEEICEKYGVVVEE